LGLSQLGKLNQFSIRRNEIAEAYRGPLADLPIELPLAAPTGFMHGYHLFAVLVSNRRQTYGCLLEAGISTQAHYVPVHHHPVSADIGMKPGDLPVCDRVYEGCLSLSMFPGLNDGDIDTVVKALRAGVGD
jgi:dTDP-4-amino-4,6-dideoxygalactose transaminase